jgi:hypothetical protein
VIDAGKHPGYNTTGSLFGVTVIDGTGNSTHGFSIWDKLNDSAMSKIKITIRRHIMSTFFANRWIDYIKNKKSNANRAAMNTKGPSSQTALPYFIEY